MEMPLLQLYFLAGHLFLSSHFHPFADGSPEQGHPEREDPGDPDGAGQLWHVQGAGQLPGGMPEDAEAGLEVWKKRVGAGELEIEDKK